MLLRYEWRIFESQIFLKNKNIEASLWLHSMKNKKKLEMEGGEKLRNYFYNRKLFLFSAIKWKLIINIELIDFCVN